MSPTGPRIYLFYAGLLHSEWYVFPRTPDMTMEVYNGGYVWVAQQWMPHAIFEPVGWYRPDKTPVLIEDVPKKLRAMSLLLT